MRRRHQVAAAEDAAHGYGINEMRVGGTLAVRADFCRHRGIPLPAARPQQTPTKGGSREGSIMSRCR
jgi:hypothetical protein